MVAKPIGVVKQIQALEGEEALIEARMVHQGVRDASRRNRIEEELSALHKRLRQMEPHVSTAQPPSETKELPVIPLAGKQT